ncbi:hypothetical protein [Nitrospira defluvii]|uniref:hypothetical protein n=1 Tax=Nitrospira defluvii TaxID=330214 RepID=UPI001BB47339|nr:hypothetical protein [Nitrospira defluvii]
MGPLLETGIGLSVYRDCPADRSPIASVWYAASSVPVLLHGGRGNVSPCESGQGT